MMDDKRHFMTGMNVIAHEYRHKAFVEKKFKDFVNLFDEAYDLFLISLYESRLKYEEGKDKAFHQLYLRMSMKLNSDVRTVYWAIHYSWYATAEAMFREFCNALNKIIFAVTFPDQALKVGQGKLFFSFPGAAWEREGQGAVCERSL
jgi:hypothetical protein